MIKLLKSLLLYVDRRQKIRYLLLLTLMVIGAVSEMVTIGAVIPFLAAISEPELVFNYKQLKPIFIYFNYYSSDEILLPVTLFFVVAVTLSGVIRLALLYYTNFIAYRDSANLGCMVVEKTLKQPYSVHISRNSSDIINSIVVKINSILQGVTIPVLNLISAVITISGILLIISFVNYQISFLILGVLGFVYYGLISLTKRKVLENSKNISIKSTYVIKILQESIGGIRDIIINSLQDVYGKIYRKSEFSYRLAQASNAFIGSSPRYVIETIGMVVIAFVAYNYVIIADADNGVGIIPILGSLTLALQKLLPLMQIVYSSIISIKGSSNSLIDVLDLLKQDVKTYKNTEKVLFDSCIKVENVNFKYPGTSRLILNDVTLEVTKGECIGIIGTTGSGKSTLIDLITGLLEPSSGYIKVDDIVIKKSNVSSWMSNISHVPQSIYLTDSSIESNIAFGVEGKKIDKKLVIKSAEHSELIETIEHLPEKYKTSVGERGVSLSGGQRQRVGLARALYKNSPLLILDEATSALDSKTELQVMTHIKNIENKPTIIIIAHRLTTLKECDLIIEMENGRIKWKGTYSEIKQ